jgi:hypothetical protein
VFGDTNCGQPDPDLPSDPPMLHEARVTSITALGALKSLTYIYDYGDNWQHRVKVEKVLPPDPELHSPLCLAGRNACPPEDVVGGSGYLEFLDAINDPSHEEHHQMLERCGGSFNPDAFDLELVNPRLSEIRLWVSMRPPNAAYEGIDFSGNHRRACSGQDVRATAGS